MFLYRLRHSMLAWWLLVIILASATASVVGAILDDVDEMSRRFGNPRSVFVTTRSVAAGRVISAGDVRRVQLPATAVPASPVVTDPVGRVARIRLAANETLVATKVGPAGRTGPAAMIENGERGIAVPRSATVPALRAGDLVDVLVNFAESDSLVPAYTIARSARVIGATRENVVVAVPASVAAKVIYAASRDSVALAVHSDGALT